MEASAYNERPDVLAWRVSKNDERLKELEGWRRDVDADRTDLGWLQNEMKDIKDEMKSVKRTLVTLIVAISGSSITFALSVLAATGRI